MAKKAGIKLSKKGNLQLPKQSYNPIPGGIAKPGSKGTHGNTSLGTNLPKDFGKAPNQIIGEKALDLIFGKK